MFIFVSFCSIHVFCSSLTVFRCMFARIRQWFVHDYLVIIPAVRTGC